MAAALLMGCDTAADNTLDTHFVVESVLLTQKSAPELWLSKAAPLSVQNTDYRGEGQIGAAVTVRILGPQLDTLIRYAEVPDEPGTYVDTSGYWVRPLHTYELAIEPANAAPTITATTVVPDTFAIVGEYFRDVVYDSTGHVELRITRGFYPGREMTHYTLQTEAWNWWTADLLVPSAMAEHDAGNGRSLRGLGFEASPILNLASSHSNDDGTYTIRYPLAYVNYFRRNDICIFAMDDNTYDFMRSLEVQQGGSSFAPGEIPNPIPHIDGAHGLFGSGSRRCISLNVLEPE